MTDVRTVSRSGVQSPLVHGEGGLADGLRQGGVRVTDASDVLGRTGKLHYRHRLCNEVGRTRADDVDAEDAVGPGVGEDLYQTLRFVHAAGPAIVGKREFADAIVAALLA